MLTQLDAAYDHEEKLADRIWLTQPMGGGALRDLTWREAMAEVRCMATYLGAQNYAPGSRIAIFSKNCAWWILADLAIWMAGHVSVPIYPNLSAASIQQILEHSGAKLVFIGKLDGFAEMEAGIPAALDRVGLPLSADSRAAGWDEIIAQNSPLVGKPNRDPDELATIIYTSGSTGVAKGVMHSFRTMSAAMIVAKEIGITLEDRVVSYLPLAHVAERALMETPNIFVGYRVFFAESLDTFVADVQRARPTIFGSVPRLWLKFQSGVFAKLPEAKLDRLLRIPIVSGLIKRKIRRGLGLDAVRYALCGSAPVPAELLAWYAKLGIEIQELYGMTENFAVSHATRATTRKRGYVGAPLPGVEQKLSAEDELLVKTPGLMLGYYEAADLSAEAIDSEGWLHTGDRGSLDSDGQLKIVGRVKELFKTSKGKYVAPAPLENLLLASSMLEQALVTGPGEPQPFALVVLSPAAMQLKRESLVAELVALRDQVNAQLSQHEQLSCLVVIDDEWTIENGMLTPTLKVKRSVIEKHYADDFAGWLSGPGPVVWSGAAVQS